MCWSARWRNNLGSLAKVFLSVLLSVQWNLPWKRMIRRFFSYVYVLSNIHKHLCTGCMLHEHVQGKPCNELFLLSHSHTCESLFKHLVPEDCRTRFCVRQIDSEDTVPTRKATCSFVCLWGANLPLPSPCSQTHVRRNFPSLTSCILSPIS